MSIGFPGTVTVGQSDIPATLTLTNTNTFTEGTAANFVCNAGEASPPCASPESGNVLVPACTLLSAGTCSAGNGDPGVIVLSPSAMGQIGNRSSCGGMPFTTSISDPVLGAVRFTPPADVHVSIPGGGFRCIIEFRFSVLKSPTGDADPLTPGNQIAQAARHHQWTGPFDPGAPNVEVLGTAAATTVLRAGSASITTLASPDINLGGRLTDTATVTRLVNPVAGSTVTFRLYPPSAPLCTGPPVSTNIKPVTLAGGTATVTSDAHTPTATGVYRWVATFDGDANNLPVSGACGEAAETRTVSAAPPPLPPPPPPAPPPPLARPPSAAKLEIERARVLSASRRLDVLAPITTRASGTVDVSFQAAGRTQRFTAPVSETEARVSFRQPISAAQARLGTGILTIAYPGDSDTQPQNVRLRAAPVAANLNAGRPAITAGRLQASGRISARARGVVRLQVVFEPAGRDTRTLAYSAPIASGRYSLNEALPADVLTQIAARRGVVHSYTLFTGHAAAHMRGELASFQVLPSRR